MYKILISLSSNVYSRLNIDRAKRMIKYIFPDIIYSKSVITISDEEKYTLPFRNVVGVFYSDMPLVEVNSRLINIEQTIGKNIRDKELGRVIININLLKYDKVILRTEELERDYIQNLLQDLNEEV